MITALLLLACVFLVLPLPKGQGIVNFSYSLKLLSLSFASLGIYCIFKHNIPIDLIGIPFLFNTALQAHLLGNIHINMINPKAVKLRDLLILLIPVVLLIIIGIPSIYFYGYHRIVDFNDFEISLEKPDIIVRFIGFAYYIIICIHYMSRFYVELSRVKQRIGDYTSEAHYKGLYYIQGSFIMVILVVISSLCQTLAYDKEWCSFFNFCILTCYVGLGLLYVQYPRNYYYALQELSIDEGEELPKQKLEEEQQMYWPQWREQIIKDELYTQAGLTINQLAQLLCTNRTVLSLAINQNEEVNFNTFINRLRISKAQELLARDVDLTLVDVCLQVGYTDQANFSRHFKNITGSTPLVWRKNLLRK